MRLKFLLHLKHKRARLWHRGAECERDFAVRILGSEACAVVEDEQSCASHASSFNQPRSIRTGGTDPTRLPLLCRQLLHTNTARWFP